MHFDYDHLRALGAILRQGSFDLAAAEIGVTPSAISQRLKALEEHVGARLVVRGAPCTATDLGRRLARHMEDVALMEAQLLPSAAATPRISIAVNADSLATWIIPALALHKAALFEIIVDDQDHSLDLLASGDVIAALTARAQPVRGCDVMALGALRYVATASPDFARTWFHGGVTSKSLSAAPALIYSRKDALQSKWATREAGAPVRLEGHVLPSSSGFVDAAKAGLGWGLNPEILVRADLATGGLVALGRNPIYDTPLYWQVSRRMRHALASLTVAIQSSAKTHLIAPKPQTR